MAKRQFLKRNYLHNNLTPPLVHKPEGEFLLALPKVLPFGNKNECIHFVFRSLIRTVGFAQGTLAQQNSKNFGFVFAYSYLCPQICII